VPYAKPWTTNAGQPPTPLDRRVWVDLDRLYGTSPSTPPDGAEPALHHVIHLTGRVPGVLKWWQQAIDRRWYGRVDFPVYDPHGAIMLTQRDVLVPAEALSPLPEQPATRPRGPRRAARPPHRRRAR
jgi:hypothetical protein